MSFFRRAALVLFCCLILVLTWGRGAMAPANQDPRVAFVPLAIAGLPAPGPDLALEAAWELRGTGDDFGGYSGLVPLGDGGFLAISDRGRYLRFADPSEADPQPRMGWFLMERNDDKREVDSESLTRDPETGTLWTGYEQSNAIVRGDAQGGNPQSVRPAAMRDWPSNGGPEAMVRLADGRFIVLSESREGWFAAKGPALLFPSDPVAGAEPTGFHFAPPSGYRPTDMAQLPDGRVLILLRRVSLGGFTGKIVLADPAAIREGGVWKGKVVADLHPPLPTDNYEGLAIEPTNDGGAWVWVISDDNAMILQRTLLLKLHWKPEEQDAKKLPAESGHAKKASGQAARPLQLLQ